MRNRNRNKNREETSTHLEGTVKTTSPILRERNVAYNPAIGAAMIKNYLLKHYPELISEADKVLPDVFKDDNYFPPGINYFDGLKSEFKTITGKKWDENIDTYLAFANLKALENISKILLQQSDK